MMAVAFWAIVAGLLALLGLLAWALLSLAAVPGWHPRPEPDHERAAERVKRMQDQRRAA